MNLDFEWMEITNFRSFLGKHKFTFNKSPGLHFVRGRNELEPSLTANNVGKSTLFDCLIWILYGKTTKGLRNPNLIPWETKGKTPEGLLSIGVGGKPHRIARLAETNGIQLDGKGADQSEIDKLLQLNYETFLHTILLGQGKPLFFDLQPRQKMDLFSEVLNLERWEQRSDRASDKAKSLQTKSSTLSGQMEGLKRLIEQARETLSKVKIKAEGWSQENQDKIEKYQGALKLAKKELARIQKIKDEATLKYESASVEAIALRKDLNKLGDELVGYSEKYHKHKTARDALELENNRHSKALKELGEADNCPICKQPIKGTELDSHKKLLKKNHKDVLTRLAEASKNFEVIAKRKEGVSKLVLEQRKREESFLHKASEAESTLRIVATDVANYEATCRSLTRDIQTEQEAENPYREQLSQLRNNLSKAKVELKTLEEDHTKLLEQIDRTKYWVKGFKDVRLYVIEEVLHELELTTNVMLPEVGLHEWEVSYDIEKETKSGTTSHGLNVTILSPSNKAFVPWEVWGGGISQRLRIISGLAFGDTLLSYAGVAPNLEILDEPTRSLSAAGVRDLVEFLSVRARSTNKQIFLVDHMARESNHFESVTTVVKNKKGSYLE